MIASIPKLNPEFWRKEKEKVKLQHLLDSSILNYVNQQRCSRKKMTTLYKLTPVGLITQHIPVLKFSGRVSKYILNLDFLMYFSFMLHKSSIVSSEIPSIFSKIGNYLQNKIYL